MEGRTLIVGIQALLLSIALPAEAQEEDKSTCAPFDVAVRFHAERLGETRVAQGIVEEQMVMIFASPLGESWSLVVVDHDGTACMKAHGTDWQVRNDPAPVPEEGL